MLVARVWALGEGKKPVAQMSVTPGSFLCAADNDGDANLLTTGVAPWEVKQIAGMSLVPFNTAWGTGENVLVDGKVYPWGVEKGAEGEGADWQPVKNLYPATDALRQNDRIAKQGLRPAMLPPMLYEARQVGTVRHVENIAIAPPTTPSTKRDAWPIAGVTWTSAIPIESKNSIVLEEQAWQSLIYGEKILTIPAHTARRIILDLDNYYCAYPNITVSGGKDSFIRVHWAESLVNASDLNNKGHRDEIEGKCFTGLWYAHDGEGDIFLPLGSSTPLTFAPLWWQCGRYVEIVVKTESDPLTIDQFTLYETRYPLENHGDFAASDPKLGAIIPMMVRAMQMCAHETYFDCPFYEQLMYAGDTRLEVLTTYVLTPDDKLPRKALKMFDASRLTSGLTSGLTQSRYPSSTRQIIPPFSLWWVCMVHDFAMWRGDRGFILSLMPGVRAVLEAYLAQISVSDGLMHNPNGWNFGDWVPGWHNGNPPGGEPGEVSAMHNFQLVYTLQRIARLEHWLGETELATRLEKRYESLRDRCKLAFWNEPRGLFTDTPGGATFSEHVQCLASLCGLDTNLYALLSDTDLARTTIYFTHYLFETYRRNSAMEMFFERLELWQDLVRLGFKTTVESPEPSRSDCHAWGAHPLWHYYASILGIRPASFGFETVDVRPQLGHLTHASGTMPHPKGVITVTILQTLKENREDRAENELQGTIILPEGVIGNLWLPDAPPKALHSGENIF
jgi:alpha-L-rhamnosidase